MEARVFEIISKARRQIHIPVSVKSQDHQNDGVEMVDNHSTCRADEGNNVFSRALLKGGSRRTKVIRCITKGEKRKPVPQEFRRR